MRVLRGPDAMPVAEQVDVWDAWEAYADDGEAACAEVSADDSCRHDPDEARNFRAGQVCSVYQACLVDWAGLNCRQDGCHWVDWACLACLVCQAVLSYCLGGYGCCHDGGCGYPCVASFPYGSRYRDAAGR